jgi:DNA-3-methyladenine glycosylase
MPKRVHASIPDKRLQFPGGLPFSIISSRSFFRQDTAMVAQELIGCWIVRRTGDDWFGARIVETEAYLGIRDAAAHSFGGRKTERVGAMYLDGGHLYVYFIYGMHHCANVVTGSPGVPEAVLLRAAERIQITPPSLLSGPGRLCAAMGISKTLTGADLIGNPEIMIGKRNDPAPRIASTRRIGVDYAGAASEWLLRFYDQDSQSVSGPAGLRPPRRQKRT